MKNCNVILANGEFPTHAFPLKILNSAKNIICTDGSADKLIDINLKPNLIIGDLDSLKIRPKDFFDKIILDDTQNNNDLEKAIVYFIDNFPNEELYILGANGLRDDHNLANLLLLSKFSKNISILMISNYSKIFINKGKNTYPSRLLQKISILTMSKISKITTEGLKYKLNKSRLLPDSLGISNVAIDDKFTVNSSGNVFIFMEL